MLPERAAIISGVRVMAKIYQSWAVADDFFAERLRSDLEAAGHTVVDRWHGSKSQEGQPVDVAIAGCQAALVLVSHDTLDATIVRREIDRALDAGVPIVVGQLERIEHDRLDAFWRATLGDTVPLLEEWPAFVSAVESRLAAVCNAPETVMRYPTELVWPDFSRAYGYVVPGQPGRGKIRSYDPVRGHGWVTPEGGGTGLLLHVTVLHLFGMHLASREDLAGRWISCESVDIGNRRVIVRVTDIEARPDDPPLLLPHDVEGEPGGWRFGVVKWFNHLRGFGFIDMSGTTERAFIHQATIRASGHLAMRPGQPVEIRVARSPSGPAATAIRPHATMR
jgi:cold shock protein